MREREREVVMEADDATVMVARCDGGGIRQTIALLIFCDDETLYCDPRKHAEGVRRAAD